MLVGIIKEQVLALYPDAICKCSFAHITPTGTRWDIISGKKLLGFSYQNEQTAWKHALSVVNNFILNKFKGY